MSDGVSGAGDSDAGETCESIRVVSCESRTIHPAVLFGVARSAILLLTLIRSAYICGHRQVVRHQLPKLTLAGSSPVARSRNFKAPATVPFPFTGPSRGLEPDGVARLRERASVPQRAREGAAGPRSMRAPQARASPVARSRNFKAPATVPFPFTGPSRGLEPDGVARLRERASVPQRAREGAAGPRSMRAPQARASPVARSRNFKAPALAMFAPIPFVFRNLARNRCLGEGHLEPSPKNKYRFVRNERLVRFKSNENRVDRMHRRRPGT